MTFTVIDKKTGEYPDLWKIALEEDWAKSLMYCDMEGFAIEEDGTLILLDECGNHEYCPADRFEVVYDALWISPKDRLPEKNGRYIVAYEDATSVLDFFNGKWFFPWHTSPGCIAIEEEGTIQAWVPFPSLPRTGAYWEQNHE